MTIKKEIILVGTFHFEQEDGELLKEKKQEILELVDYLSQYQPTKIALEWEQRKDEELNKEYKNADGYYPMDEVQQIGFRLAKKLQHKKVFAVNWEGSITQDDMNELNEVIQNKYPQIVHKISAYSENEAEISRQVNLVTSYQQLNSSTAITEMEEMYASFVDVNKESRNIGVDFLKKWTEREQRIFKNIVSSTDKHDERVLLIVGSDHIWMLRNLFEENGWNVIHPFAGEFF